MTKAKARQRAKAKAGHKARKRKAEAGQAKANLAPGRFDPGNGSIKGPKMNANTRNFATEKRGAGRSR